MNYEFSLIAESVGSATGTGFSISVPANMGEWLAVGFFVIILLLLVLLYRRQSPRQLTELLDKLPSRIGVVDQKGRILYTHLPDYLEPIGSLRQLSDLPECYRESFSQAIRKVFKTNQKVELNYQEQDRYRRAEFLPLPTPNAFHARAVVWISTDLTALHQAHAEIAAMAEHFRLTLESIGDGVIATDAQERVTLFNPSSVQLTGYTTEQAIGRKMDEVFNIVSYIDGSQVASPLRKALQSGQTVELANHTDLIARDGSRRHIADCASPLRNEAGEIIGGVLVFRDVTQEYEQRDLLRMHSAILKTIGRLSRFSYFHCNADGSVPQQNLSSDNWPQRDGVPIPAKEWVAPEDYPEFLAAWQRLLGGEDSELHVKYSAGTGAEKRYFEMRVEKSVHAITLQPDFFGVVQDITEARRDEFRYRDNYRLLQLILDHLPAYIFVKNVNDDFRYILANRAMGEVIGVDHQMIPGKFDHELFPCDAASAQKFRQNDEALVASGEKLDIREFFFNAQGGQVITRTIKDVLTQSDGSRLLIGMGLDMTRQYELEEEQKRTIKELNAFSQNEQIMNQSLTMITLENDLSRAVSEILRIIGENVGADRSYIFRFEDDEQHYSSNEYEWVREGIAPQLEELQHVDMTELGAWNQILREGREIIIPDLLHVADELVDAQTILLPQNIKSLLVCGIRIENRLWGYVGVDFVREHRTFNANDLHTVHNIVNLFLLARERAMQFDRLADSVLLQRQIVDNITIPIGILKPDFSLVAANPRLATKCATTPEELSGQKCYHAICHEEEPPDWCPMRNTLENQKMHTCEHEQFGRLCHITTQPIFDRDGNLQYVLKSDIDIDDLTRQKQDLQHAMELAQAADRAKSYFLATMSHELRTPLNAVIGFSELLQNSDLSAREQQDYLQSINCAGTTLLHLINDILDLSKLEADQLPLSPSRTNVAELIDEVASVFRLKAQEKQISLVASCQLIRYPLYVDNLRLRQIMLNLIGNAVKFTHTGGVSIEAEFTPSTAMDATGTLDIRVIDTGIGISNRDAAKIFNPFVQSESTRGNRVYEGSGLGLAISQRLAQRMGGSIKLTSTPGEGSIFHISVHPVPFDAEPFEAVQTEREASPHQLTALPRILLVDDVPMNLKVLEAMLKKINIPSASASSGLAALELLRRDPRFTLVLTDIWMPEMNGMELAHQIHLLDAPHPIRVVAVTADTQVATDMPEIFNGVLLKPITSESLQAAIAKTMRSAVPVTSAAPTGDDLSWDQVRF